MLPDSSSRARIAGVYLLTPDAAVNDFDRVLRIVDAALAAGVRCVQFRNKRAARSEQAAQAERLTRLAHQHGALMFVNDDPQLALEVGADGVHLGRDDAELAAARAVLGPRLLGASCYDDLARADRAVEQGADALAFGSVFASRTKPTAVRAPVELLTQARRRWPDVRVIAIGGIDQDNIVRAAAAGAHATAVIAAIFDAAQPAQAARQLIQRFDEGCAEHESQRTTV